MAKLRKFCAYRRLERPFTRKSKYRKKNFVRVTPNSKVVRFEMGNLTKKFDVNLDLVSKTDMQIRHNAIESARQTSNRVLEKNLGKTGYKFKINIFPHHVLRENPLAAGAGADRMSTGMKMSFGKSIGTAARVKKDQKVITIGIDKANINVAKTALRRAYCKLPGKYSINIQETSLS